MLDQRIRFERRRHAVPHADRNGVAAPKSVDTDGAPIRRTGGGAMKNQKRSSSWNFGRSEEEARKELGEILGLDLTNPPVSDHYRPAFEQMIAKLLRHRERKLRSKAS